MPRTNPPAASTSSTTNALPSTLANSRVTASVQIANGVFKRQ
jgi:hypothetical protein